MDPTPLTGKVLDRLVTTYGGAADATKAAAMRAYMRDQFPFLGIRTTERRALSRQVLAGLPRPDEDDLRTGALACWALPEREYRYFACDWLRRHATVCTPGFLVTARTLVTAEPWWDTVDTLAANVKAIGWALRQYAKTDPETVRAFVREHEDALAPLSVREAVKSLWTKGL